MKTYIWTLPTRIFHWMLAAGFATAYILSDFRDLRNWHMAFGALVTTLILFRFVFGVIGPVYSRFSDFPVGWKKQKEFVKLYFKQNREYAGHNPMAAFVMLLILVIGFTCGSTGFLFYLVKSKTAFTGFNAHIIKEIHEVCANIFLGLVITHVLGILGEMFFHRKEETVFSMFTGFKNVKSEPATLKGYQKIFTFIWLLLPILFFYLAFSLPHLPEKSKKHNKELEFKK